ncbi:hypothetical protein, partial [Neokomagataea anthophila]
AIIVHGKTIAKPIILITQGFMKRIITFSIKHPNKTPKINIRENIKKEFIIAVYYCQTNPKNVVPMLVLLFSKTHHQ